MKISSGQSTLLTAIVLAALNVGMAILTFGPLTAGVDAASRAVVERRATEHDYLTRARDAERARATLEAVTGDETRLQSFFISPANVLPFVLALEANARESQVSQAIAFLAPAAKSDSALNLRITAEGAFPNLVKYMGLVENMPAYVTLTNITLQTKSRPAPPADGPALITLVYNLTAAATQPITELEPTQP